MPPDAKAFLWDVCDCADAIAEFVNGRSLPDYLADRMLRSAVERQFEIIGEALNRLAKTAPELGARIPQLPQVVAFRNLLIHGYATVHDAMVWKTVQDDLPDLRAIAAALLEELDD